MMSCFPCFSKSKSSSKSRENPSSPSITRNADGIAPSAPPKPQVIPSPRGSQEVEAKNVAGNGNIEAQSFTFRELAAATRNFRPECLLGEGGFGRVYKGFIENTDQVVAIKQLDRNGFQGNKEFLVEVLTLSLLHHQNLVNLVGYCADGDQRLLVYEYMPLGSLDNHLLDIQSDGKPLSWYARMKIATGAARGLEYLHEEAKPPVIYRDLKSANILLDGEYNAKLSDFGLAKLGPMGDKMHFSSRVMGTYGYCAPEYARSGDLTLKSDVYSFGVLMLELITGRRAIDTTKTVNEQNLVSWAQPMFKDQKRFPELVDPLLGDNYPLRDLNQAVAVAAMCLQDEAMVRPLMTDVVMTLSFLQVEAPASKAAPAPSSEAAASTSEAVAAPVSESMDAAPLKSKSSKKSRSSSSSSSSHSSSDSDSIEHKDEEDANESDDEEECQKGAATALKWGSLEQEQWGSQQEDKSGSESESESESESPESSQSSESESEHPEPESKHSS